MTLAEIKAAIKETPALATELFGALETDFTKFLTDEKSKIVTDVATVAADRQKVIDDTTAAAHSKWEKAVEPILGVKPAGTKGLDWVAETSKKGKFKTNEELETQNPDSKDTALKQLQTELATMKTDLAKEKAAVAKAKVDAAISSTFEGFDFAVPAHIKDDAQKSAFLSDERQSKSALFGQLYKDVEENGKVVFERDGVKMVDNAGNPLTVSQIITKNHAHWQKPAGHSGGGAGTGGDPNPAAGKPEYKGATSAEIGKKLDEEGLIVGSIARTEAYEKAHAAAGILVLTD